MTATDPSEPERRSPGEDPNEPQEEEWISGESVQVGDRRPATDARDARASRPGPLSRYLLVLAVAGVAVAIYLTAQRSDPVPVLIAARDISPYQVITADDLIMGTRDADEDEHYAELPVEGRLSLRRVAADQPLRQDDVAPDVARVLGADLRVHGFTVAPATVLGGALQAGDRIQLLLVRDGRRLARLDAVVLAVSGSDPAPARTLVVALKGSDVRTNEVAIGTGAAVVIKNPAAAGAPD